MKHGNILLFVHEREMMQIFVFVQFFLEMGCVGLFICYDLFVKIDAIIEGINLELIFVLVKQFALQLRLVLKANYLYDGVLGRNLAPSSISLRRVIVLLKILYAFGASDVRSVFFDEVLFKSALLFLCQVRDGVLVVFTL